MTVTRSKDGIPSWDGTPSSWSEYRKAAYSYEETVKWESRYLCGPRLAVELTGAAKMALANKKRGWLSTQDGVDRLLNCLRETMAEPALPEVSNQLKVYFRLLKRKRGESMTAFIARHREEYARTCKALTRVMREQRTLPNQHTDAWRSGRRSSTSTATPPTPSSQTMRSDSQGGSQHSYMDTMDEEAEEGSAEGPEESWTDDDWWWWWYHGWYQDTWEPIVEEVDSDDEEDFVEILPDVIKGWLLLEKASIEPMERSLIQSEIRNNFSLASVESALRSHFTDDMIKRRDGEAKHSFFGEDDEVDEPWEEDESFFDDMSEEAIAMYQDAKTVEQQAWAQIQQGRQTLREARARQHEVRMGRRFFENKKGKGKGKSAHKSGGPPGSGQGNKGQGPCARCGESHDTSVCPKRPESGKTYEAEHQPEMSEYIYAQWPDSKDALCWTNLEAEEPMTTDVLVRSGYGVLDGGATRTMASVTALEYLQSACPSSGGFLKVDTSEKPTFGFGNSDRSQCVSTVYYKMPTTSQDMCLRIHALDQGSAPVLVSVDTLRKMGAIIDFRADQAVFSAVDPHRLVPLKRSAAGHQLIPLAKDFLKGGTVFSKAVNSLSDLIE